MHGFRLADALKEAKWRTQRAKLAPPPGRKEISSFPRCFRPLAVPPHAWLGLRPGSPKTLLRGRFPHEAYPKQYPFPSGSRHHSIWPHERLPWAPLSFPSTPFCSFDALLTLFRRSRSPVTLLPALAVFTPQKPRPRQGSAAPLPCPIGVLPPAPRAPSLLPCPLLPGLAMAPPGCPLGDAPPCLPCELRGSPEEVPWLKTEIKQLNNGEKESREQMVSSDATGSRMSTSGHFKCQLALEMASPFKDCTMRPAWSGIPRA